MASANFTNLPLKIANGSINFGSDTFKALLVSAVPSESNLDSWIFRSDVTSEVGASGSYATGGASVTCTVGATDTTNNRVPITFGNPANFTSATISAVGAIIYDVKGSAATDILVTFVDFGGTVTSTNGTFSTSFNTPLYINR